MPILDQWDLRLDADAVLRGQGADPNILRLRRPRLFEIASQVLNEALPIIHSQVLYERFPVDAIQHTRVRLAVGNELKGEALTQHLGPAQEVLAVLCTIGSDLEELASLAMETERVYGFALYGVGSAAVEALANAACLYFEEQAAQLGWQTTIPLSPGMIGWSVEEGQPQIFSLLEGSQIGVQLTELAIMLPMKSLSPVLGLDSDLNRQGTTCDYCTMRNFCKYQANHAQLS
jgi:hypothetical protein